MWACHSSSSNNGQAVITETEALAALKLICSPLKPELSLVQKRERSNKHDGMAGDPAEEPPLSQKVKWKNKLNWSRITLFIQITGNNICSSQSKVDAWSGHLSQKTAEVVSSCLPTVMTVLQHLPLQVWPLYHTCRPECTCSHKHWAHLPAPSDINSTYCQPILSTGYRHSPGPGPDIISTATNQLLQAKICKQPSWHTVQPFQYLRICQANWETTSKVSGFPLNS